MNMSEFQTEKELVKSFTEKPAELRKYISAWGTGHSDKRWLVALCNQGRIRGKKSASAQRRRI